MARARKKPVVMAAPLPEGGGIVEGVDAAGIPLDAAIPASELPAAANDVPGFAPSTFGPGEAIDLPATSKKSRIIEFDDVDDIPEDEDGPLVKAAKSGDRRLLLIAMRDRLAYMLEKTDSGRDVAAIARNLNIVSKELDGMTDPDDPGDDVDQMAEMVRQMQS